MTATAWVLIAILAAGQPHERVLRDDLPSFATCIQQGAAAMLHNRAIRAVRCEPLASV